MTRGISPRTPEILSPRAKEDLTELDKECISESLSKLALDNKIPSSQPRSPSATSSITFLPSKSSPATMTQSLAKRLEKACSLEQREEILKELLSTRTNWKYVLYNEIARTQFELSKYENCLSSISEAKILVERNPNKSDSKGYKSKVYYNHSQFFSAFIRDLESDKKEALNNALKAYYQGDTNNHKLALDEAYDSIKKAVSLSMALAKNSTSKDNIEIEYYQDCLVHQSFLADYLDDKEIAQSSYQEALELNQERFVEEYTTEGTGRELFFWALDNEKVDIFKKLLELKQEQIKYTGSSKINPNVSSILGVSLLVSAMQEKKTEIVDILLELGADPLYHEEDHMSALEYALSKKQEDYCKKFRDNLGYKKEVDKLSLERKMEELLTDEESTYQLTDIYELLKEIGLVSDEESSSQRAKSSDISISISGQTALEPAETE